MAKITINDLMEAGCHFGHQTKRWNPKMKHFVYGAKNGISIIDLTKTMHQIADACNFLQNVVMKGGDVLFVGTKRQAREITAALAERTGMYHVSERWLGGTLTNNVTIRKSISKMYEIDKILGDENTKGMKKKEMAVLSRNAVKLHRDLDGLANMKKLPAVVIDTDHELNAVKEANKLNIPIVAIVDTNGDPSMIQYPVAANDDAVKSIQIITDLFADAILIAKEIYQKRVVEERDAKEAAAKKAADEKAEKGEDEAPKAKKAPAKKAAAKKAPAKKAAPKAAKAEEAAPAEAAAEKAE